MKRCSWLVAIAITLCSVGCGGRANRPMSTALFDVTGESRVLQLRTGPLDLFSYVEHHEAISLNGLLPMADVGQEYHFPADSEPTSAVGIAVLQSYRLIGETEAPAPEEVFAVRSLIEEAQTLGLRVAQNSIDIANLRSGLERLAKAEKADEASTALVNNLKGELDRRTGEQAALENAHADALRRLRDAAAKPGILIGRWVSRSSASGGVAVAPVGAADIGVASGSDGFVVLGGLRFVALVYGEDFWHLFNNLRPEEKKYIDEFGVTTYLVQARYVAYTSAMTEAVNASLRASLATSDQAVSSVSLALTLSQLGQYSNSAALGAMEWRREPFCFVCGLDLPQLATDERDRVLQASFGAGSAWNGSTATLQGWRTIAARVMYPRGAFMMAKPWENYLKAREMHAAPTCPTCSAHPNHVVKAPCPHGNPAKTSHRGAESSREGATAAQADESSSTGK